MKLSALAFIVSIAMGVAAALLTGLVGVTPAGLVGATWYGYPLVWLRRLILSPEYYPWRVDWFNLILDIVLWCAIAAVIGVAIVTAVLWRPRGRL